MDRLWAPWRLSYVTAAPTPATECIFCDAAAGRQPDLLLWRGRVAFVILNLYPYNNGHLMVVPNRHLSTLESLADYEKKLREKGMAVVEIDKTPFRNATAGVYQTLGYNEVRAEVNKALGK